jgi:hypothetical protein
VLALKGEKPVAALHGEPASELDRLASTINSTANRDSGKTQANIRAELTGSERCCAEGLTARGASPVFSLCRLLLAAGHDPDRSLEVFRGDVLALRIRTIREGARFTVKERPFGPGFEHWVPFFTPPVSPPVAPRKASATSDRRRPLHRVAVAAAERGRQ